MAVKIIWFFEDFSARGPRFDNSLETFNNYLINVNHATLHQILYLLSAQFVA